MADEKKKISLGGIDNAAEERVHLSRQYGSLLNSL